MRFDIESRDTEGTRYVAVAGELDLATAPLLAERLAEAQTADVKLVVLDLADVSFMDSAGLHVLLEAYAHSQRNCHRLQITAARSEQVQRLFELAGVRDKVPISS